MNLLSEQLGKIPFPLLQESHPVPVTYPRHKQDPLSFINDLEPKGLQSENTRRSLIIPEPSQKNTEQDTNLVCSLGIHSSLRHMCHISIHCNLACRNIVHFHYNLCLCFLARRNHKLRERKK